MASPPPADSPAKAMPEGAVPFRRIASRVSRCSVLTEDLLRLGWSGSAPGSLAQSTAESPCREAGHYQACRQAGEEASPDHGDSRDRSTAEPIFHGHP